MLIRIGAALTALYLVHGADQVARDGDTVAQAVRDNAPKAAIGMCIDNLSLCQAVAGQVVGAQAAQMAAGTLAVIAPKPPRRSSQTSTKNEPYLSAGLDREGLKRAILARG